MNQESYKELKERFKEIAIYSSTSALLGWDQETNIPKNGLNYRAEQCAFLGAKAHSLSLFSILKSIVAFGLILLFNLNCLYKLIAVSIFLFGNCINILFSKYKSHLLFLWK